MNKQDETGNPTYTGFNARWKNRKPSVSDTAANVSPSSAPTVTILHGHVLDKLRELPNASVQCVVTSPPYWGLRDYSRCGCAIRYRPGTPIPGETEHLHDREESGINRQSDPDPNCPKCHGTGKDDSLTVNWSDDWRGQLGLEPTPDLYVQHLVAIFHEMRRVLRDDGTFWLVLGDSYVGANHTNDGGNANFGSQPGREDIGETAPSGLRGLPAKNLVGIPWRVAFALQADGWWLRSDIIWSKPNPMPESVTDRPTRSHEYIFLLTKNARYFFDADAVREGVSDSSIKRWKGNLQPHNPAHGDSEQSVSGEQSLGTPSSGRNLRSVWNITTQPYREAHFATFPETLAERCIKAGTSENGGCAVCGAPWEREIEKVDLPEQMRGPVRNPDGQRGWATKGGGPPWNRFKSEHPDVIRGLHTICKCGVESIPCVVLDPFAGSGTVGAVARRLGRSSILIEIKEEYIDLIKKRIDYEHKALDNFGVD